MLTILLISCSMNEQKEIKKMNTVVEIEAINTLLDNWHKNAAEANFEGYFNAMSNTSVFIGTYAS
jgi:hypothetical protein